MLKKEPFNLRIQYSRTFDSLWRIWQGRKHGSRPCGALREAVPAAEEVISYKIPTYKLHGGPVLYFAGWKQHYLLYPATDRLVEAFKDDLAPYDVDKGTIRFPLSQPVPVKLIARIAKFRAKEAAERARQERKRSLLESL